MPKTVLPGVVCNRKWHLALCWGSYKARAGLAHGSCGDSERLARGLVHELAT